MFARMTTITIKLGEIDRAIATFRKSVLPAAKMQRGFRGACLMVDRPSGKGIAVTFWPSEKTASVNENNLYYQAQLIEFLDQFASPPIRQGFEVCVHDRKPPRPGSEGARSGPRVPFIDLVVLVFDRYPPRKADMLITKRIKNDVVIFDVDGEIKRSDITDTTLHDLVKSVSRGASASSSSISRRSGSSTASASGRSWPATSPPTTWAASSS